MPLASTHCLGLIIDAPFEGRRRRRRFQGPSSSHILPGPRGQRRSEQMEKSRHTLKLLLLGLFDVASWTRRFTLSSYRNSFSRQQQRGTTARSAGPHLTHCSSSLSFFFFLLILSLSPSFVLNCPVVSPASCSCEWTMRERGLRKWKTAVRRVIERERERRAGKRLNDALWAYCCLCFGG